MAELPGGKRRQPSSCPEGWLPSIHRRITGLRENAHHHLSRLLVRKYAVPAIESLNVANMDKLRNQARSIRDAAIGGLLQKLRYKAEWYGTLIVEADRWFPSSKLCSHCSHHHAELIWKRALASGHSVAGETAPDEMKREPSRGQWFKRVHLGLVTIVTHWECA